MSKVFGSKISLIEKINNAVWGWKKAWGVYDVMKQNIP